MQTLKTLIDKASKVCGSDAALAERLGVAPQVVSMLRKKRTITPCTAAELADIAGDDAREAAIQSIIESAKGTRREGVISEILGKGVAAGVAVMCLFSYKAESTHGEARETAPDKTVNSLYIVEYLLRTLTGLLFRFASIGQRPICLSRKAQPKPWVFKKIMRRSGGSLRTQDMRSLAGTGFSLG